LSPPRRLYVRARRTVFPDGERPACLVIEDGKITRIDSYEAHFPAFDPAHAVDARDLVVLPGLVDPHVHANEPGRTDWEGLKTATRAAAAGGITTLVDMPLNSLPPTTSVDALDAKRAAAQGKVAIDVAFWGGVVPGNAKELAALASAGVCGFKAFMIDSGVPEFPPLDTDALAHAISICTDLGATLIVHAEAAGPIDRAAHGAIGRSYAGWLASRPQAAEVEAITTLVRLMRAEGAKGRTPRIHVVHLSAADALPVVAEAQASGLALSAETCPHYLALAAEEIADGATLCKCAPPIREAENRERLWQGLAAGTIALVASDHSPSPPSGKALDSGDFGQAWGGVSSLGLGASVVWTEASKRGHTLVDLARWMSEEPAKLVGLGDRKGALEPGMDADFCLFDDRAEWTVDPSALWTRHKITPYAGRTLRGRVRSTWLSGTRIYEDARFKGEPRGRLLSRATKEGARA
jgi:allantoinase